MQELEKILEEIKEALEENKVIELNGDGTVNRYIIDVASAWGSIKAIIHNHMNDGGIPVNSHGLPSSSEHDFRFWVTVQYKNGFRRTLKATWNYYNNHFVYQNGKIISEDVVAYRYYSVPKPYQPERSER